ncbi:MAG: hypothetical protein WCF69_16465 [Mycobacterium sp.]
MTVAAFVLAVIGTITAAVSLTWNIVAFLLQGARPKLTPIIGIRSTAGLVHNDATRDIRESLVSAARQVAPGPLVIGVKVINAGRAPFHDAEWALRSDPSATSFKQFDNPLGSPTVGCDIAPGASEMLFTDLNSAYALVRAGQVVDGKPQRIVLTVSSGGRTYKSKPVFSANLDMGAP